MFRELHPLKNKFVPPKFLWGKIALLGTCECTPTELDLLRRALFAVCKTMETHPSPRPEIQLNIFILDQDRFTLHFDDIHLLGANVSFIALFVGHWRKVGYSPDCMFVTMLEELCHNIWCISDESEVQKMVDVVLKDIDPSFASAPIYRRILEEERAYFLNRESHPS